MATATYTLERNSNGFSKFLLIVIVLAFCVGLYGVEKTSHSHADKHPESSEIRKCLEENGPQMLFWSSRTKHYAEGCQYQPDKWGVRFVEQIDGLFEEITIFGKEGTLADLENYLVNDGYMLISH